ncbi:uncharacterized protein LACBIDRAFT_316760 [Laccaria bicolor S238N-H82]|uniref:Predicted protein n=1 Tax=Laccaria bicolor (strain S238N-H82 / ATCC MYA-4686) TaxID=486041 RepID=B0E1K1_LACBS|nr:uncharacterized protein LACBIDRAFT_316760 [Laccaria bicolor S238N-H82]EDQ99277.1 predicted protein [Laccaria bicolor S238N-H82]|eukprot:XP_001890087.1 predicted protein [Laccaria bicolor S238N-H82]
MRKNDKEILRILLDDHIDTDRYGLGINSFCKIRWNLGVEWSRRQNHTVESIHEDVQAIRRLYPLAGAREMKSILFHDRDMDVERSLIIRYFHAYESDMVKERKARRLKRRRFWAAGVNDLVAVDQHDKWKRFGLALHIGEDPFCGVTHWLRVWHNNNNPKLVLSYYLDWAEVSGYIPLITQSDLGSENYGIANAQSILRQWHDPRLEGTVQHRWMRSKKNVKPEIAWSQFRRRFAPGFETIIQEGVTAGWYDMTRPLDVLVFRWLFIPWLQTEINAYVERVNNTRKRADRNKVLPHGPPNDIFASPERYGCLDFKVKVEPEAFEYVREKFAPPSDPVFELVPPIFAEYAGQAYAKIGSPELNSVNIWPVYCEIVLSLQDITTNRAGSCQDYINSVDEWQVAESLQEIEPETPYPLIDGRALFGGDEYLGGVNEGWGLDTELEQRLDAMEDDNEFEPGEVHGLVFSEDEDNGANPEEKDNW